MAAENRGRLGGFFPVQAFRAPLGRAEHLEAFYLLRLGAGWPDRLRLPRTARNPQSRNRPGFYMADLSLPPSNLFDRSNSAGIFPYPPPHPLFSGIFAEISRNFRETGRISRGRFPHLREESKRRPAGRLRRDT